MTKSLESHAEKSWYRQNFAAFENSLNGEKSGVLHAVRRRAFDEISTTGLPTTQDEEWRYTNLQALVRGSYSLRPPVKLSKAEVSTFTLPGLKHSTALFVNGHFVAELSDTSALSADIEIHPIGSATKKEHGESELVTRLQSLQSLHPNTPFLSLNTAFLQSGLSVTVKKGRIPAQPLHVIYVATKELADGVAHPRLNLTLEEGSEFTLLESFVSLEECKYFRNPVLDVVINENAKFKHAKLQQESRAASHIGSLFLMQHRASSCSSTVINLGGALVRNEIRPTLDGPGIETLLFGLTKIDGEQHVDNHLVIDHAKPNCFSRELFKGVYSDHSSGVFSGTIIVRPDAQKTNAVQSNQSLLLSPDASIDTRPQLKIFADDVKCTHGATVGQLDDDALFYLRSRGLSKELAQQLLLTAFAIEVLDAIPNEALRTRVGEIVSSLEG